MNAFTLQTRYIMTDEQEIYINKKYNTRTAFLRLTKLINTSNDLDNWITMKWEIYILLEFLWILDSVKYTKSRLSYPEND